jgi:hypothetical protein
MSDDDDASTVVVDNALKHTICMIAPDKSESALHSHSLVLLHEYRQNLENNI